MNHPESPSLPAPGITRPRGLLLALALLVWAAPVTVRAQEDDEEDAPQEQPPAARPRSNPEPQPAPASSPAAAKTIWDYQKPLGLSDNQVRDMKSTLARLQQTFSEGQQPMADAERRLARMIQDEAPMEQVRTQLRAIALMQADLRAEDIAASRRINSVMTPAQLRKWKEIQRAAVQGSK